MAIHSFSLVLLVLLAISQDSEPKRPSKPPPVRILPGQLRMNVEYLQECEDSDSDTLGMRMTNARVRTTDNNFIVMEGDLICTRMISPITQTVLTIFNCPDRASGDCSLFQTWRFGKESCSLVVMRNQLWSPIFQNLNPRFKCPNPAGPMELRNASVDMRLLQTLPFPLEKYYWRVRLEVFDTFKFFCVLSGGQCLRSRT